MAKEDLNQLQAELLAELEMAEKQEVAKELEKTLSSESTKNSSFKQNISGARKDAQGYLKEQADLSDIESFLDEITPASEKVSEQYAQSDALKAKVAAIKSSSTNFKLGNEQVVNTQDLGVRKPSRAAMHSETLAANRGKSPEELNAITDQRVKLLEEGLTNGVEYVNSIQDPELKNKVIKGLGGALSSIGVKNLTMSAIKSGDMELMSTARRIDEKIGDRFEPAASANYGE
jgi:hypothetical protein